jgi:hypothetical protein
MPTTTQTAICASCSQPTIEGDTLCTEHREEYDDEHTICDDCGENTHNDEMRTVNGSDVCDGCVDRHYTTCYSCDDTIHHDDANYGGDEEYRCNSCHRAYREENGDDLPERHYSTKLLPEFSGTEDGEYIHSTRIFSAEIEAYYPGMDAMHTVARNIPQAMGISSDGSLDDDGVEFQTPKLQGKKGEDAMIQLCTTLNSNGFRVNATTGLHIHIDGEGLIPKRVTKDAPGALQRMMAFYLSFEDVIISFLPPSRRKNSYARLLNREFHVREIMEAKNERELEKMWYRARTHRAVKRLKEGKYHDSRYNGVNLHSLFKDGHLEIRYHSGTINPVKILEWTGLHLAIIDGAVGKLQRREVRSLFGNFNPVTGEHEEPKKKTYKMFRSPLYSVDDCQKALALPDLREKTELMFKILGLSLRSQQYFRTRQELFTSTHTNNGEGKAMNEVCAE